MFPWGEMKKKTVLWKTSAPWLSFERILWGTLRIFKRYWYSVAFNSMVTLQDFIHLQLTRFGEAHKGARMHSIQSGKWDSHACIRRHAFRIHDRKPDGFLHIARPRNLSSQGILYSKIKIAVGRFVQSLITTLVHFSFDIDISDPQIGLRVRDWVRVQTFQSLVADSRLWSVPWMSFT